MGGGFMVEETSWARVQDPCTQPGGPGADGGESNAAGAPSSAQTVPA